ncbi:MAG: CDP-glycerol glycerophosphotransferase family protein [Bacteroidota bacterium]
MLRKIVYVITLPALYLLYGLSGFVPRDKSVWIFGSWNGTRFADNSKWFYLYCNAKEDVGYKYIWISKSRHIVQKLREHEYQAYYLYSLTGLYYCLRGGVYIFDSYSRDISYWLSRNARKVLLQHGVPIKKIGRDIDNPHNLIYKCYHGNWWEQLILRILQPWWVETYDLIPATSEYCSQCFRSAFAVDKLETPVTGFSRNDVLFNQSLIELQIDNHKGINNEFKKYDSLVLYMPTFRDTDRDNRKIPIDWKRMNELFKKYNALFLLKLHPNERFDLDLNAYSHIEKLAPSIDVYAMLRDVDILITDYSSISMDYMNMDGCVFFYVYDKEDYITKDRSLYIDLDEVVGAQPQIYNFGELDQVMNAYFENPDKFELNTQEACNKYHVFNDGKNSSRLAKEIVERLIH